MARRRGNSRRPAARRASGRYRFGSQCLTPSQATEVEVHGRPADPGRLRGRDRHPPPLHDRSTVHAAGASRRRRSRCPRWASRSARRVRAPAGALGGRRPAGRLPERQLRPEVDHRPSPGIGEVGKTTVYMRSRNADDRRARTPRRRRGAATSSRSPPAACTSAARCASSQAAERFICPCHGGVYDFTGQGRRRPAGPPARPLLHARPRRPGRDRAALLGQLRVPALPELPRPGPAARRDRPVPLPGRLLDARSCRTRRMPKLASPADPEDAEPPAPPRPARAEKARPLDHAKEAGISAVDWVDERTSLSGAAALGDVPQGPEGDELVLHAGLGDDVRLPVAGGDRRVPGDVLHAVGHATRTSRRATSPTTSSSASSCAACTSGARP